MFCYQCEQTAKGQGCTTLGVCGKVNEVSNLQDLLIHALQGLSLYAVEGRKVGVVDPDATLFTCEATFSTLTNVDFDPDRLVELIKRAVELRERMKDKVKAAGGNIDFTEAAASFSPADSMDGLAQQAEAVGIKSYPAANEDILSLKHTLLFIQPGS